MDILIQTSNYIYFIECKLDGGAEEAMQQIEAKNQQLLSLWISELYYQSRHQLLQQDQRSRELEGGIIQALFYFRLLRNKRRQRLERYKHYQDERNFFSSARLFYPNTISFSNHQFIIFFFHSLHFSTKRGIK